MVLPCAIGAITPLTPIPVRRMATTARAGLAVASSSVQVPGRDGAGGMESDFEVATDFAADTVTAVDADIVAGMDTAEDTAADTEAELLREALLAVERTVDM